MTASRRTFLSVVAASSAASCLGPLAGCAASGPSGQIDGGNVSDLEIGEARAILDEQVAVLRDAVGVWAVTTICTHLQCDIAYQGSVGTDEIFCECHASTFTPDGDTVSGPATRALDNFAVSIDTDGAITIDADTVVDPGTRTAVPAEA